jgi:hypothetical protein
VLLFKTKAKKRIDRLWIFNLHLVTDNSVVAVHVIGGTIAVRNGFPYALHFPSHLFCDFLLGYAVVIHYTAKGAFL